MNKETDDERKVLKEEAEVYEREALDRRTFSSYKV